MIDKKKLEEIYNVDWAKMPKDLITTNVSLEQWKYMIEDLNLSCRMIELIYDKKKGYTETLRSKFSKFVKNDRKESTRLSNLYFYGVESTNSLESKKIKTKDTMNERYGDWFTKTDDYIEKSKNTNLKRYGTEFALQNEEIKKKVQETNLKHCGYKTNLLSEDNIKKSKQTKMQRYGNPNYVNYEKSCQTKLEKYGDKNYNNIEQIKKAWANKSIEEKKDIFYRQSIKAKETNLLKYGVEHYSQTKEFKDLYNNKEFVEEVNNKIKETNLSKYGSEYYSQTKEFKDLFNNKDFVNKVNNKRKETSIKRYGVDSPFQSNIVKEHIKASILEKYGVEHIRQSEYMKNMYKDETFVKKANDNRAKTMLERYGVNHNFKIPAIREKIYQTNLIKYGKKHYSQTKEFLIKSYNTMKKNNTFNVSFEEDKVYELLSNRFPDVIRQYRSKLYPYNCDFYIPSIDTYIEYQGNWTHGDEPFNSENIEHLNRLKEWENKSKYHPYYKNAIYVWTNLDMRKRDIARQNNINFIEFWSLEDVEKFISDFSKK